jgi:catechol 2,3-dioxygenase-like lactoylglutathione lyase family enzyme
MITGISIVSVWVLDQDSAKDFYAGKLGFTVTNDIKLDNGMRWLTVRPPGSESQELLHPAFGLTLISAGAPPARHCDGRSRPILPASARGSTGRHRRRSPVAPIRTGGRRGSRS